MNRLIDLLAGVRTDGYPTDFLLARLQARIAAFAERCPAGRGEEGWLALHDEYRWLFRRMNRGLRNDLAPVFFYFELRNLFAALRFGAGADRDGLTATLAASLLGPEVRLILTKGQPFPATLTELGRLLDGYGEGFDRLAEIWRQGGHGPLETALFSGFSRIINREQPPPAVRDFLARLLERRQLLRLAKGQRWQLPDTQPVAHQAPLRRRLKRYLEQLPPRDLDQAAGPARLDTLLLRTLLRDCRRAARTGRTLPMFLGYLCSCWLTARDCGVRGLTPLLSEGRIAAELGG
jgi:hypothetical protein